MVKLILEAHLIADGTRVRRPSGSGPFTKLGTASYESAGAQHMIQRYEKACVMVYDHTEDQYLVVPGEMEFVLHLTDKQAIDMMSQSS